MTVRTTNIAFRDLDERSTPRFAHREGDDIVLLQPRIAMIEVEYDDVALAAVDARMSAKVLTDERAVLFAVSPDPGDLLPDVDLAVTDVVLAPIFRVADTTPRLASALCLVMKGKFADRL
jgi:hypothetical protein